MKIMVQLVDPACRPPESEALPRQPGRRPGVQGSIGEPPGDDDEFLADSPEFSPSRLSPLPRILMGARVLVVDDDEDTTELFATALAACGAQVVTATGAREALRRLTAWLPDVVVSDIAMPGADGYWLVNELRGLADERAGSLPVVAVTAFGREHSRARALAAGFVDHLVKPVEPEALCRAVARAMGR
jgi:CheY-like chemotaxis protein